MRTSFSITTLAAAIVLAVTTAAQAGGGMYMGGGGGGGRGMSGGGGFGGGGSMGRGMGAGSGGAMSAPSAGYGSRPGNNNGGRDWSNGGWNGNGNGNGYHNGRYGHGRGHGYWNSGWYYPYWYWPAWGATIAVATTWPYWSGTWVDPYYYPAQPANPYYQYYGPPSGTIIQRDQPGTTTPGSAAPPQPYRLYCPATNQYYPDVSTCEQQWLKVLPNDGVAPTPPNVQPQSSPQSRVPSVRPTYPGADAPATGSSTTSSAGRYVYARATTTIPAPRAALPGARSVAVLVAESSTQ